VRAEVLEAQRLEGRSEGSQVEAEVEDEYESEEEDENARASRLWTPNELCVALVCSALSHQKKTLFVCCCIRSNKKMICRWHAFSLSTY